MPIGVHLALVTVVGIVGLVAGFALGITGFEAVRDTLPEALGNDLARLLVFGMLPAVAGYHAARGAFTRLVAARCPTCGGAMEHQASHRRRALIAGSTIVPVSYRCTACGHVHVTRVSDADPRHLP